MSDKKDPKSLIPRKTAAAKPKRARRTNGKKRGIFVKILLVLAALFVVACLAVGIYVLKLNSELPDISAEDLINAQTSFVYDENGTQIATLHGGENRISVELSEMPTYLLDAVVASEDIRFYKHIGVDVRSIMRAVVVNIKDMFGGSASFSQGASTITMQLVKNVTGEDEKKMSRKIKEALLAIKLEKSYDKDEILYYYVNEIYMGPGVYGMQAASKYYFNKDVGDITLVEAATLVAILRSPGYYDPYTNPERVVAVRDTVLNMMVNYNSSYAESVAAAKAEPLVVYEGTANVTASYDYPWFVDAVIDEAIEVLSALNYATDYIYTGGLQVYTTMDPVVQQALESVYADSSYFPSSSTGDIVESAMAIVEPGTGAIKGLVGGREYTTRRGFNRATSLQRSPGSSIKPLVVYAPAIELGYGAGTVIDDSDNSANMGTWMTNNDDFSYSGRITLRQAVVRSRNVCAVKVLHDIGTHTGYQFGIDLGLSLDPTDAYNLSLATGGTKYGVNPLEMATAFATLANEGINIESYTITEIRDARGNVIYSSNPKYSEVFSAATAFVMTDVLTSAVTSGTGTNAQISGWQVAGKTGTNSVDSSSPVFAGRSGNRDVWFCGYTTALAGAVWMGYDNDQDADGNAQLMAGVYGGTYPARVFSAVMSKALTNYEKKSFSQPSGVISVTLDTKTGKEVTALTPEEYIQTDYFTTNGTIGWLEYDGEVEWASSAICSQSGLRVGPYCSNYSIGSPGLAYVDSSIVMTEKQAKAADYGLYIAGEMCTAHFSTEGNMLVVKVCTHPDHNGEEVLANVPGSGKIGGCPDEYVVTRYYTKDSLPTRYCGITEHQLMKDSNYQPGTGDVPEPPTALTATAGTNGIELNWSYESSGVLFVIERTNVASQETDRFTTSRYPYTDNSDLESGITYSYRVRAYSNVSQKSSSWTSSVSVTF